MLHAILSGKAGRVTVEGETDQSWREVFRKREDLLTAAFFGRIRYLSVEAERKVLSLLVGRELADRLGEIQEIIFWPKLRGKKGRQHVEPDVLVIFVDSLVVIEVKPPFGGDQREGQWHDQVESLVLQRVDDEAEIEVPATFHFLALGRNMPCGKAIADELLKNYADDGLGNALTCEWDDICKGIVALAGENDGRDAAIYADWIEAFDLFGITEKPLPFSDLLKIDCAIAVETLRSLQLPPVSQESFQSAGVDWSGLARICQTTNLEGMQLWR